MNFFINEILENDQIKEILKDYNRKDEAKEIAEKVMNGETVKVENGIFPICVLAYLAPYAIRKNEQRGIIKEVTVKSLKDINVWIDNYFIKNKELGLGEFNWLIYHYTGDLFHLGRLQFRLEKSLEGIPECEYAIETHIPQGEALTEEKCLEAFEKAKAFFAKYFPEVEVKYFMCDSWLLNPNLEKILKSESNIVKFMKLWTPVPFVSDNSSQAIQRVFGFHFKKDNLISAPENTSLQKALKEFLLNGGTMDITLGYRKI
ncbi:MAG: hypothetical protein E7365_07165 [Clostridiales bacterium]|nr:hypothetical protein [Clostridiales bacterium]